eukprot:scaffold1782_cov414-Prasinococcus_capsulatus_cf.AAC.21
MVALRTSVKYERFSVCPAPTGPVGLSSVTFCTFNGATSTTSSSAGSTGTGASQDLAEPRECCGERSGWRDRGRSFRRTPYCSSSSISRLPPGSRSKPSGLIFRDEACPVISLLSLDEFSSESTGRLRSA